MLTIKQPWVCAIFSHGKDVENRSWATSYRGKLLIHASQQFARTDDAHDVIKRFIRKDALANLLTGHIVGSVELVDCVRNHRSQWADRDAWHWVLRNPRPFKRPIEIKGRLGLWRLPDGIDICRAA